METYYKKGIYTIKMDVKSDKEFELLEVWVGKLYDKTKDTFRDYLETIEAEADIFINGGDSEGVKIGFLHYDSATVMDRLMSDIDKHVWLGDEANSVYEDLIDSIISYDSLAEFVEADMLEEVLESEVK